jgi:hypothetical protein
MGMTRGVTICCKHDDIMELADTIINLCSEYVRPTDLSDLFGKIADKAEDIAALASDCKEDGQSMESGLDYKRERIQELEDTIEELEAEVVHLRELVNKYETD